MANTYSQEFINKVKEVYPNSKEIKELADKNQYFLGRYLDDSSSSSIGIGTILNATSLESLQQIARTEKMKCELYAQWHEEVKKWKS